MNNQIITAGDFLAGGGGVTEALSQIPSINVKWVLNHDPIAIRTNLFHHRVKHFWVDIYKQKETDLEPVDFAWASIECTQHSKANGGRSKKIGSYTLAWELERYIKFLQPFVLGIENVPEFKKWAPLDEDGHPIKDKIGEEFENWKRRICNLGYDYHEYINNAADFGLPTRRLRYFAFFTKKELGMKVNWPVPTHNKNGAHGKQKWVACKNYIDLGNEGVSIFGREYNPLVPKNKRQALVPNSLKRIAGGIKKYAPELSFIFQYYGNGDNVQSLDAPLNTVTTKDRHVLVTLEKIQFLQDYYGRDNTAHGLDKPANAARTENSKHLITIDKLQFVDDHIQADSYNHVNEPLNPQLTRQNKRLISVEGKMLVQHYSGEHSSSIDEPLPTITTVDHNTIVDVKAQFIASQYNSNGNPGANNLSIEDPIHAITTQEKFQFITTYFSSNGNQGSQNSSLEDPMGTITTATNKKALITALMDGSLDFDVKMRFITPEELSRISSFPEKYFTDKRLKLTVKEQVKLIGNAVPPEWAKLMIQPVIEELQEILSATKIAI